MFNKVLSFFKRDTNNRDVEFGTFLADLMLEVNNASTSALSGFDLFKFMNFEKSHGSTERALRISAVYCALNMYVAGIKTLPRHVTLVNVKTGERERRISATEASHPGIRIFLQYANPDLMSTELVGLIANDLLIDGNFYALRQYDSQGRTFRIHYIHPSRIPRGNIKYANGTEKTTNGVSIPKGTLLYKIETGDYDNSIKPEPLIVTKDDMVHIKSQLLDVRHNRGFGIIENAQRNLTFSEYTEKYGTQFFENGMNSQIFLSTDKQLAPEYMKRLESYFMNNPNEPLQSAFRARIFDQGIKPVNAAIPLQQLQFIETRAFSVEDIARWFMIPPELLQSRMGTQPTGNVGELINLYVQFGIGPLLTHISESLKAELLPLTSQPQYIYEFERIYLYRTVINEFSQAIRNLFEIGVLNRAKIADMVGVYIDPKDDMNYQRMLPTNLMTIGHAKALETKAETANLVMEQQLKALELQNENYVSPTDMHKMQMESKAKDDTAKDASKPDEKDKSPDDHNIDKKVRTAKNAFNAVSIGLVNYLDKVAKQKEEKYVDNKAEYITSLTEFFNDKFLPLVNSTLEPWKEILEEVSPYKTIEEVIENCKSEFERVYINGEK